MDDPHGGVGCCGARWGAEPPEPAATSHSSAGGCRSACPDVLPLLQCITAVAGATEGRVAGQTWLPARVSGPRPARCQRVRSGWGAPRGTGAGRCHVSVEGPGTCG
ncbi:hypothetical protein A3768_4427 (plasmid) [Ralstonia solanacearum]|nr:hypothetical protein F504_5066 [Ralstonia pseudosolanacearum FQY_4]ANH35242.1 hypothetical protein A3768_4427 [Ralstonia solanacearum]ARU25799.1 hypothetical protein RSSE_p1619 [Ralstonia solanacearum]